MYVCLSVCLCVRDWFRLVRPIFVILTVLFVRAADFCHFRHDNYDELQI